MRAESSISPLALGVCSAVVAGALALAPPRGTSTTSSLTAPAARGADVVALESEAMNRAQPGATPDVGPDHAGASAAADLVVPTSHGTGALQDGGTDTSCAQDCHVAQQGAATHIDTASDGGTADGADGAVPEATDRPGDDAPDAAPDATAAHDGTGTAADGSTGTAADGSTGTAADGSADAGEDRTDLDSCRSPRAVVARNGGDADVAPASPCSRGHGHDPCGHSNCREGGSNRATEA